MNEMTTEKAIYQLTDLIKDRESFCHRDDFDDMFLQDIEALKVGISALEKQMPKKPIEKLYFYGKRFYCSECQHYICADYGIKEFYCSRCGQNLDWSEEE